jgi:hypothetical protein
MWIFSTVVPTPFLHFICPPEGARAKTTRSISLSPCRNAPALLFTCRQHYLNLVLLVVPLPETFSFGCFIVGRTSGLGSGAGRHRERTERDWLLVEAHAPYKFTSLSTQLRIAYMKRTTCHMACIHLPNKFPLTYEGYLLPFHLPRRGKKDIWHRFSNNMS